MAQGGGRTASGKDLIQLTLAANRAIGGTAVEGYHIGNLLFNH